MKELLYVVDAVYLVVAISFIILYRQCKDPGYLAVAILCAVASILSACFLVWWPLLAGVALAAVLFFYGTAKES